jgi:WD40 repeat protein
MVALRGNPDASEVWLIDVGKKERVGPLTGAHTKTVTRLAFSADGRWLLTGAMGGELCLWDVPSRQLRRRLKGHDGTITGLAFSPDGNRAISAEETEKDKPDAGIHLWDLRNGTNDAPLDRWQGHTGSVSALAWSPDGSTVISVGGQGLHWWDPSTGLPLGPPDGGATYVAFSADSRFAVCSGRGGGVRVYEVKGRKYKRALEGAGPAAFPADTNRIICVGGKTVRLWDHDNGQELRLSAGHLARVVGVEFAPDGERLASLGQGENLLIWDLRSEKILHRFLAPYPVVGRCWSPGGNLVVTSNHPSERTVWNATTGKEHRRLGGLTGPVWVGFTGDRDVLSLAADGKLVWGNVENGAESAGSFPGTPPTVTAVQSFDGTLLLRAHNTGGMAGLFSLVALPRGEEVRRWESVNGFSYRPALAPDNRLVYCPAGTQVGVYDLKTDPPALHTYNGNHDTVPVLALAPDGKVLATADGTGKVVLWNALYFPAGKGKQILAEWKQPAGVLSLAFSRDSRRLAVGNEDGTVFIYRLEAELPGV